MIESRRQERTHTFGLHLCAAIPDRIENGEDVVGANVARLHRHDAGVRGQQVGLIQPLQFLDYAGCSLLPARFDVVEK
ncbi:hypothetical protein D9M69_558350 [compost metagenome]